jgi:oligopeptide/dipeptide ABC transporter ATP-binding protein
MSHRIAVMYLGRIVEMGPVADVREKRYHPYTRALFSALPNAPTVIHESEDRTSDEGPPSAPVSAPAAGDASATEAGDAAPKRRLGLVGRIIAGEPASATEPPPGCIFHTRCPKAEKGRCDVEAPGLQEIVPGSHHRVACWYPELD